MRTFFILLLAITLLPPNTVCASPYFELGTSLGTVKNGDSYFNQSNAASSGFGFTGSFNFFVPITSIKRFTHLELGLQNRLTTFSNDSAAPFAMFSPNLAIRLEIMRFYVGAGYAPYTYVSKAGSGLTGLQSGNGTTSYFVEGGLIWRVIPEFQIVATYGLEFAKGNSGGQLTGNEIGIRLRFPIAPKEINRSGGGVDFDGFRYPFGFMK